MNAIKLCSDIINKKDIDLLIDWLKEIPQLTKGPKTLEFEKAFSEYLGCDHSIYCNSGSSANLLVVSALKQMGVLEIAVLFLFTLVITYQPLRGVWSAQTMKSLRM